MTYSLGQSVELTFTTSPAETGAVTVTRPDGTVATAQVDGEPGAQTALVEADQIGPWSYVWEAPNAGQRFGTFTVGQSLVTVEQAREACGATAEDDDALRFLIGVAEQTLDREFGPLVGSVTQVLRVSAGTAILPVGAHIVSVAMGSVALTGWRYDARAGLLHGVYGYGDVTVTCTLPLTERVQQAALYMVKHLWSMRAGAQPASFGVPGEGADTALRTFAVPSIVRELLGHTVRIA